MATECRRCAIATARRRTFQLSADGDWLADYPEPSAYLPQVFEVWRGDSNGQCHGLEGSMQTRPPMHHEP